MVDGGGGAAPVLRVNEPQKASACRARERSADESHQSTSIVNFL